MTLNDVKMLLSKNNISYELYEFENEAAYIHHAILFPYTKNAKNCKVIALTIASNNKKKNIELQFNAVDNNYIFEELRFGDFGFEMFDYNEEMLTDDLLNRINEIQGGSFAVIVANNLKSRRWLGDACFDLSDDDDCFGKHGFEKAMKRIKNPKGFIARLFKSQKQYEIYDWNSYQCIVK